ncbi:Solute carrier organic anion transporter, member [Halocaridina rubra]|uniref:Solute carrier organic anion transporter, member n=1 Tax=Halocaridina rubra TaxID=373956 RepID=A0AAN9FV36_HALRR
MPTSTPNILDIRLIAGAYDIASVLCSIPVSYLGSRPGSSKPRWLGWGAFIMGMGSFLFTLPHFASPFYDPSGSDSNMSLRYCLKTSPNGYPSYRPMDGRGCDVFSAVNTD